MLLKIMTIFKRTVFDNNKNMEIETVYFIENAKIARKKLWKLKKLREKTIFDGNLYLDKKTNQKWEKYEFCGEGHSRYFGLRALPYPSISKTIDIAIKSNKLYEVLGASSYLWTQEHKGNEYRKELIEKLEQNIKHIDKEKFEAIYFNANLENNANLKDTMKKPQSQVERDYNFYIEMFNRAKKMKDSFNSIR